MPEYRLRTRVAADDAYRAVFAEGALAVANRIEWAVYGSSSAEELMAALHELVSSTHRMIDEVET